VNLEEVFPLLSVLGGLELRQRRRSARALSEETPVHPLVRLGGQGERRLRRG